MKPITDALCGLRDLLARLAGALFRPERYAPGDDGTYAREVLNQPPRPVRAVEDGAPRAPTPHW
ncbi:hypothetical protein [Streptomyces sp. NPDC054784]